MPVFFQAQHSIADFSDIGVREDCISAQNNDTCVFITTASPSGIIISPRLSPAEGSYALHAHKSTYADGESWESDEIASYKKLCMSTRSIWLTSAHYSEDCSMWFITKRVRKVCVWNMRFPGRRVWRLLSSGMWGHVARHIHFWETWCLHLQVRSHSSVLKKEVSGPSEV
jgi:hypothetical protein